MGALWHPFADMSAVEGHELTIARGDGVWVFDEEGRRYLDGSSSLWYCNVGHGRHEIADAVTAQMRELETFHVFGDLATRPATTLADRLASLAPTPGSKVFLTGGGGEAIETAVKLARLSHALRGESERVHIISRRHGYHGTHGIGTSILGMPFKEGYGALVEDTSQIAHDSLEALAHEIDRLGAGRVAAFVYEPVIGSGGVHVPPPAYLEGAEALCRRHGILTIADCVIAGFGRLGTWFGVERFGLQPDLLTFAKGVTSGYLPLGGVIAAPAVADPFWAGEGHRFDHGSTYSGHAACCAAAHANLDLLARDGLVHRAREIEGEFYECVSTLADHPLVGAVRGGCGLMAAVVLAPDLLAADADASGAFWRHAREAGVLTRGLFDGVAFAPPLVIERAEIEAGVTALRTALDALAQG
jgi:putrescine aminotransferase